MAIVPEGRQRLSSWKEIADFLGVSVRAAQRWEVERGLPVHRLPGARGPVSAEMDELRAWQVSQRQRKDRGPAEVVPLAGTDLEQRLEGINGGDGRNGQTGSGRQRAASWGLLAGAIALLLFGTMAAWWVWFRKGPPARSGFDQNTLIVRDKQDHELWRHPFENTLDSTYYRGLENSYASKPWFGDLDNDGDTEVLFEEQGVGQGESSDALTCFSKDGKVKWRWVPDKPVTTKERSYKSAFQIMTFLVSPMGRGRPNSIVVSSTHFPNHICRVVLLSAAGAVEREYWHSGHLGFSTLSMLVADRNNDGRNEIYMGGVNNGSSDQATLVVLDPDSFEGASLEDDPKMQWIDLPPGREMARLLFPRSCINEKEEKYNFVQSLNWEGDLLMIHVQETQTPQQATIMYRLDASLNFVSDTLSDTFRNMHKQMEGDKKLDHTLDEKEEKSFEQIRCLTPPQLDRAGATSLKEEPTINTNKRE